MSDATNDIAATAAAAEGRRRLFDIQDLRGHVYMNGLGQIIRHDGKGPTGGPTVLLSAFPHYGEGRHRACECLTVAEHGVRRWRAAEEGAVHLPFATARLDKHHRQKTQS